MNLFTAITFLSACGAVFSFLRGVRAGDRNPRAQQLWRDVFAGCVFATLLAAPLA
ncbi:MAG: hypothetical protein ACT4PS_12565 [Betaproteobacteria bacterium]